MFKKAFIALVFLLSLSMVFSVRLIDPLSKELSLTETNFAGTVLVGNTIEMIFSKELVDKYDSLSLVTPLPLGFEYQIKTERESIKMMISVPKTAQLGNYPFSVQLQGADRADIVPLSIEVIKGTSNVSPSEISVLSANVDSAAKYDFFFVNNSDSDSVFIITTNLPDNWVNPNSLDVTPFSKKVTVPKRGNFVESITVYPRLQGKKDFIVKVEYEDTSKEFAFAVNGTPTIKSKMSAVSYGLPFYSFSLLPSYFLNGLISFIFQ